MRRYLYLLKIGKFDEANNVLREFLPLPAVTGRVCPHLCETECARKEVDEAVNINSVERFVADYWLKEKARPVPRKYKRKTAIIGSGPAGLACAYFLTRMGYPVTVFEAQPVLGGMLRIGIPEYRLPKKILDEQINYIRDMGVEFKTGVTIGKDITFEKLKKDYQAIFFATGNQLSRRIELEGDGLDGVLWGLDFLRGVNLKNEIKVKDKIVVIGGGNVAIDVALTALRLGAKQVQLACLESGNEIPAYKEEIEQAVAEGVSINEGWGPQRILGDGKKVTGIELVRCTKVFDAKGKFNPSFDKKTTKILKADMIILAIGQAPDHSLTPRDLRITDNGTVQIDPITLETNLPGIFAGGDVVAGAASVVKAIADGNTVAVSIDRYFRGENLKKGRSSKPGKVKNPPKEGIPCLARVTAPVMSVDTLAGNFGEIKLGFDEDMAEQEVQRCMTCGSQSTVNIDNCILCTSCATNCPAKAVYVSPVRKIKPLGKISDSLDEIAKWMKADPEVLKATIAEYNASCDQGYDSQFAKEKRYLQALRTPPYYVFKCSVVYLVTMGGIRVNQYMEAVDDMDKPIPGLFAAGSDTGGYESDTYCVLLPGSTFGFAINSGRIAGENAAKYTTKR
jgi:NADPH-dependent glutamate synthase beta subunit-like oxidoreductase